MKMQHYRAPDMRQALRQVRDAQGPDAVILSSRKIPGGVEVVAAIDYDGDGMGNGDNELVAQQQSAAPERYTSEPEPARVQVTRRLNGQVLETERRPQTAQASQQRYRAQLQETQAVAARQALPEQFDTKFDTQIAAQMSSPVDGNADMNEELRSLRRMLETQLATLAWNDLSRRAPVQTELLKQLSMLGLSHELCGELVAQIPPRLELSEAHRIALALIARRLDVVEERWVEQGGIVAMVGPTGVGKTTLIAKLAARWVMRHGSKDLAIVTCDSIRFGAQEQIHTLGRLLGAPAFAVDSADELAELLDRLGDRRLVLIDTAGLSQRDAGLTRQLTMLAAANAKLETCLVLSGAAQAGAIEESLERFAPASPSCCVLTKLDEATSLGGALSALIRARLPLAYMSDGQRVPEDLHPARAHQLVARAVDLSRKSGATIDEDLLQRRFGAVAHALA